MICKAYHFNKNDEKESRGLPYLSEDYDMVAVPLVQDPVRLMKSKLEIA